METNSSANYYRENNSKPKPALETTLLAAPGVRRTVATAGLQRRRVIKKHIQQKYLLCGFAIHAFLATPAYLYGNVVESDKDLVLRIWPAIVYQATNQLCQSILEHLDREYRGRLRETAQYRRIFLLATLITCASLMISGILFSSAWVTITTATQAAAIIFYGFFAGIGSSLFVWKTHVILEAVRPREDKFVPKTIHLFGEAFCQLFLSFVFTSLRTLYGTAQSIMLMSALLVNLIPISLIITRHRDGAITKRMSLIKSETIFPPLHHQLGRYPPTSYTAQMDGIDAHMQRPWKNPMLEHSVAAAYASSMPASDTQFNYILPSDDVTFINPNGVEIMEIIPEEDENVSVARSSSATINHFGQVGICTSQTIHKSNMDNLQNTKDARINLLQIQQFFRDLTSSLWLNVLDKVAVPLHSALLVPKLYSTTLLLSTDTFSYVMCLTVLPGLAMSHHAIKNAEIPFLFSLLAFPWMCFSLMTPRFGDSLYKHKFQWYTLGCICKGLALIGAPNLLPSILRHANGSPTLHYIFYLYLTAISFSTSKLLLSVSSVLLGFGQAVALFLQDFVLQKSMSRAQWNSIQFPVHFTNGLLILVWGSMAHWVVVKFSFQASVGLAGALYAFSILLWHFIYICSSCKPF